MSARAARRCAAIAIAALVLCGRPVLARAQPGATAPAGVASPAHAADRAPPAGPAAAGEPTAPAAPAAGEPTAPAAPAAGEPTAPAAPAAGEPTAPAAGESPPPTATMQPVGPDVPRLPPRLDGSRLRLPPMVIAQDRPGVDRRPIYLGAGLIVLAAVFWWNRRRRDRFEREDGTAPARPARRPGADADADDLHAAARGDGLEPGDSADEPERPEPP